MDPNNWQRPTTLEELHNLPKDTCYLSLRQIVAMTSEDLFMIPERVEKLDVTNCDRIESLEALHHLVYLDHVWCTNCLNVRQDDVSKLRARGVLVDTWGCWQLRDTDAVVMQQYLDIVGTSDNWGSF